MFSTEPSYLRKVWKDYEKELGVLFMKLNKGTMGFGVLITRGQEKKFRKLQPEGNYPKKNLG